MSSLRFDKWECASLTGSAVFRYNDGMVTGCRRALFLIFMAPLLAMAETAAPAPPATNPHPPVTAQDKQRVAFAEAAIRNLLMGANPAVAPDKTSSVDNLDLALGVTQQCLADPACVKKDARLQKYAASIMARFGGAVSEFKHLHVIPWAIERFEKIRAVTNADLQEPQDNDSQPKDAVSPTRLHADEYIMHAFARFQDGLWYHLDTIVSEDTKGNMLFNRFFIIVMPSDGSSLPPGVDC